MQRLKSSECMDYGLMGGKKGRKEDDVSCKDQFKTNADTLWHPSIHLLHPLHRIHHCIERVGSSIAYRHFFKYLTFPKPLEKGFLNPSLLPVI